MVSEMQTSCVFTARNTGCGKAMFSQVSVNLLTGEGISGTRSLLGGGAGIPEGRYPRGCRYTQGGGRYGGSRYIPTTTTDILWWPSKHVRLAGGWYTFYWNAVLFIVKNLRIQSRQLYLTILVEPRSTVIIT